MSSLFTSVDQVRRTLDFHVARHNVLASNLANVNTPAFRPLELVREPPASERRGVLLPTATTAGHVGSEEAREAEPFRIDFDDRAPPGVDGNAVSLEHESAKLAANDLSYETATRVIARQLAMLRYAANDGTGG